MIDNNLDKNMKSNIINPNNQQPKTQNGKNIYNGNEKANEFHPLVMSKEEVTYGDPKLFGNTSYRQNNDNITVTEKTIQNIKPIYNVQTVDTTNFFQPIPANGATHVVYDNGFLPTNNHIKNDNDVMKYITINKNFDDVNNYYITYQSPQNDNNNNQTIYTLNLNNNYDLNHILQNNQNWINPYFSQQIIRSDNNQTNIYPNTLSISNPITIQDHTQINTWPKPVFSYSCLIALALRDSDSGALPVNEIYKYMMDHFPYFRIAPDGWKVISNLYKNSVRHNLSLNKAFTKTVRSDAGPNQRKGCFWTLKDEKKKAMEREIKKWFKKHPQAIKDSMSHWEKFEAYFSMQSDESSDDISSDTHDHHNIDGHLHHVHLVGKSTSNTHDNKQNNLFAAYQSQNHQFIKNQKNHSYEK